MKIAVTKEHINNGVAKDSTHCMIADAIKGSCPRAQFIQVDLQTIRWTDPTKGMRFVHLTPAIAQSALLKFDQGQDVKPFSFSLTPASQTSRTRPIDARTTRPERRNEPARAKRRATRAHKEKYAYLAANRARNHQRDREFGLKKFAEA